VTDAVMETGGRAEMPNKPARKKRRIGRWLMWIAIVLVGIALAIGFAVYNLMQRSQGILRASLIDTLQKRFHSRVELDGLHIAVVDGFAVEANGLRIWLPEDEAGPVPPSGSDAASALPVWRTQPWIVVGKMRFHASWRVLPGKPIVISVIHVENLQVLVPPKEDRPHMNAAAGQQPAENSEQAGQTQDQASSKPKFFKLPTVQIERIECETADLLIERAQEAGKPPKLPLDYQLRKLTLIPDGHGGPVAFKVDMVNAKPVGIIHSSGHVGPWMKGDPGALPVQGEYSFDHADLGTIKGIAGILSSTGQYTGTLRRIEADGQTQTPDFRLERVDSNSGVMLRTKFHAIVDGTNGDTYLQPVDAVLGHTHILARGQVVRASDLTPGAKGHDITLDVTIDHGRIEDVLNISANTDAPFLTGNLTLKTAFHLPPGKDPVMEKLQLKGQFHLSEVRFSNSKIQGGIRQLSLRGQGKTEDLKTTDPETVLSEMQGHFELGDGNLQLPDMSYRVPGAEILTHGNYGMQAGTLAFVGDAKLDASLSQVVGGWKGFLLKPADHYLRKNGAGTDVPIHVDGTRKEPKFGVDFDRIGKKDPEQQQQQPAGPGKR